MDNTTAGIAVFGIVVGIGLIYRLLDRRNSKTQPGADEKLLAAIIERPPQGSVGQRPTATDARRPAEGGPRIAALEGHLRNAVLDANARERLVKDAMRATGGDRAAAIRKVLRELYDEDKRWS